MKARVVTLVHIAASPDEVFTYLADLRYHRLWSPNLKRVVPEVPLEKGMIYKSTNVLFGMKVSGKIIVQRLTPPKALELRSTTGMLQFVVNFGLYETKAGTTVRCATTVSTESKAFAFAKPMMQLLAKRELQSDLDGLKALAEHRHTKNLSSAE